MSICLPWAALQFVPLMLDLYALCSTLCSAGGERIWQRDYDVRKLLVTCTSFSLTAKVLAKELVGFLVSLWRELYTVDAQWTTHQATCNKAFFWTSHWSEAHCVCCRDRQTVGACITAGKMISLQLTDSPTDQHRIRF